MNFESIDSQNDSVFGSATLWWRLLVRSV